MPRKNQETKDNDDKAKKKAIEENMIRISLYKAGFQDGFSKAYGKKVKWEEIHKHAHKAWDARYSKAVKNLKGGVVKYEKIKD